MDDDELCIYIDGSALTNPGKFVGCAGVVVYPDSLGLSQEKLSWRYSLGTSGSMELMALVNAIKWLNKNSAHLEEIGITSVSILGDNQYVINSANSTVYRWSDGFNKNKWKKVDGGTVKHKSLWQEFLREKRKSPFSISISWIKGKSTPETKAVDKAAKAAAINPIVKTNFHHLPYKQGRSLLGKGRQLELFSGPEETCVIRVYSHSLVSRKRDTEYEIRFEVIRDDCIEGPFKAFTDQDTGFRLIDRQNFYEVTFSKDTKLPMAISVRKLEGDEKEEIKEKARNLLKGGLLL